MIERHAGRMQLVCACGLAHRRVYEADEFDVMISDAKDEGWKVSKADGQWEHTCPDCAAPRRRQGPLL
jgi:hypothetical protein